MAGNPSMENYAQKESCIAKNQKSARVFQAVTLIFLALLWVGYWHSFYVGDSGKLSGYTQQILFFSLLNANVLFIGEKAQNRALTFLAKAEGLLFILHVVMEMIRLVLK